MLEAPSTFARAALITALSLLAAPASASEACVPAAVNEAMASCAGIAASPQMTGEQLLTAFRARGRPQESIGLLPTTPGRSERAVPREQRFLPVPFDEADQKLDAAFRRFLCEDKPAPGDARAKVLHGEVAHAWGTLHFQANHFEESAVVFRDLAIHHADEPIGVFAEQRYLESLNVLGSSIEPPRPVCYDDMARDVPTLISLHCRDGRERVNEEPCHVLRAIHRDIVRLDAEQWVKKGDKEGSASAYESAATTYMQLWAAQGEQPCEAKAPACKRMEEILYNAARAYQAAHLVDKAIAVRKILVDPRYHLEQTEPARRASFELGGAYQSIAEYEEAASWYERFAEANPRHDSAPGALTDATVLRLALHQIDRADRDASLFNKQYGSSKPARTAQVAYAMAAHVSDLGDHAAARKRYAASMGQIDKNATMEVRIRAHAGLAGALVALGKRPEAAAEHGKVQALVRAFLASPPKGDDGDGRAQDRALGSVLGAAGEAAFFFAEEKRLALPIVGAPTFSGAGTADEIGDFVRARLGPWAAQRRAAIDEVEKAYREVEAIAPVAPPRWVVAAAARVARMRGKLAAELRAAPAPKGWKTQGPSPWGKDWAEVRAAFHEAVEQASAPDEGRATAAHERCVALAAKLQAGAPEARASAAWLSRHHPRRYPRLDELLGAPTHLGHGLDSQPVGAP